MKQVYHTILSDFSLEDNSKLVKKALMKEHFLEKKSFYWIETWTIIYASNAKIDMSGITMALFWKIFRGRNHDFLILTEYYMRTSIELLINLNSFSTERKMF